MPADSERRHPLSGKGQLLIETFERCRKTELLKETRIRDHVSITWRERLIGNQARFERIVELFLDCFPDIFVYTARDGPSHGDIAFLIQRILGERVLVQGNNHRITRIEFKIAAS